MVRDLNITSGVMGRHVKMLTTKFGEREVTNVVNHEIQPTCDTELAETATLVADERDDGEGIEDSHVEAINDGIHYAELTFENLELKRLTR